MFRKQETTHDNTSRKRSSLVDVLIFESGPFSKALTDEDISDLDGIAPKSLPLAS